MNIDQIKLNTQESVTWEIKKQLIVVDTQTHDLLNKKHLLNV